MREREEVLSTTGEEEGLTLDEMLDKMDQPISGHLPSKKRFIKDLLLTKIPLLNAFIRNSDKGIMASISLAHLDKHLPSGVSTTLPGFQFVNLGTAALDFFRIPAIYLAALITGEKPPISISKNARWVYSAALIGLTLTSILIPAAAPPIAFAMAGLTLAFSLASMANLIYQRVKVNRELRQVEQELEPLQEELANLKGQIKAWRDQLVNLQNNQDYHDLEQEIQKNYRTYLDKVAQLQPLLDKKVLLEKKRAALGVSAFMTKGVAIALASAVVIGLVVALFFPPVGLGIIAGTAGLGAFYIGGRIAVDLLSSPVKKLAAWFGGKKVDEQNDDEPSFKPVHESTADVMNQLNNNNLKNDPSDVNKDRQLVGRIEHISRDNDTQEEEEETEEIITFQRH